VYYLRSEEAHAVLDSVPETEPEIAYGLEIVRIDFGGAALVEPVR